MPARSMQPAGDGWTARVSARVVPRIVGALVCAALFAVQGVEAGQSATPQRAAQQTVVYVTHAGDSLYDFAQRYLRDPGDWAQVARLNNVRDPRHLQAGIELRVPVALLRRDTLTAKVIATSGSAKHAYRATPALPLVVGGTLTEGDRVQTGKDGFATLEFADGSHLVIPPNTTLELKSLRKTVLTGATDRIVDLQRGEVDSEVTHATRKDDRFQIRSPSVVAGVRGTRFRVNYDGGNGSTAVEVLDGAVGVDAAAYGKGAPAPGVALADSSQLVAARHGSLTRSGGAIGSPVALLEAPSLVNPSKVQDEPSVVFDIAPAQDAHGYRVQIGRDAALLDMIRDLQSESPHVNAGPLPDGTYFVRIASVDANGLRGMPNVYAFERRSLALGTSAGRVANSRAYAFRWFVDRGASDTQFRFVLGTTPDLREPIIDRTGITTGDIVINDLPKGVYYWMVVAEQFENGRYFQKASPVESFRLDW
ncbi:FecR domain-containing protein [Paraburkholderia adhaesiva]|uniref:FecR domain-containing protein n=1 Tax=Paraburkholderia adhaesiva TaxID=2883244 RepID=UPI001F23B72F|nr:FecR domain-containing protein [Paraburkholderia adhaesiva]